MVQSKKVKVNNPGKRAMVGREQMQVYPSVYRIRANDGAMECLEG